MDRLRTLLVRVPYHLIYTGFLIWFYRLIDFFIVTLFAPMMRVTFILFLTLSTGASGTNWLQIAMEIHLRYLLDKLLNLRIKNDEDIFLRIQYVLTWNRCANLTIDFC